MSRATIVNNVGRDGTTSLRLHTEPGDTDVSGSGPDGERVDVALYQETTDCYEGREQWWEHSILFPDDFFVPANVWYVVADFHNIDSVAGQANFHVDASRFDGGTLHFRGYGGTLTTQGDTPGEYTALIGPIVKNVWYDFVYHVKWSSGSDGFFNAWVNGSQVLAHSGPTLYQGMGVASGCYLKLSNYHPAFGQPTSVIHDRVIRHDVGP